MEADVTARSAAGERIRQARRELGLTQTALAEQIGVMLGVLDAFETGKSDPARYIEKIAEATNRPASWFLESDGRPDASGELDVREAKLVERERTLARIESQLK